MDDAIAFAVQRVTEEALKKEQENVILYREKTFLLAFPLAMGSLCASRCYP